MDHDDPYGVTKTAAGPSPTPSAEQLAPGARFGRYVIDRELGAGGMGIVYAAFDQELERRVALKLLREGRSDDARQRLLREARAMARLDHPNIVSVFDVGTIEGRDYVAMELIDGTNLAEWLRAAPRPAREVLVRFFAAGHGLVAAHDAGVIHRDFKPHNVLVGTNGRVAVTDFGLARDVGGVEAPAARDTPSPLSGLTVPGTIMGTPEYMAPEQWEGGVVSPATDQFAFCVALWEGLVGERPFRGDTEDALRDAVRVGPIVGKPRGRRVRAALLRGLAPDPTRRWPSLAALLAALAPRRWPGRALAGALVVLVAVALAFAARSHPAATCTPPARDPAAVWGLPEQLVIRAASPDAAAKIDDAIAAWQRVRTTACTTEPDARPARLVCLDKVLARLDALRRTRLYDLKLSTWGLVAQSFPAEVCLQDDPPRMPASYSEPAVIGLAMRAGAALSPQVLARIRAATDTDPCARSYAAFLDTSASAAEVARDGAQLCGDDQAFATATMNMLTRRLDALADPGPPEAMREVERAIAHAAQPFLSSQYYRFRAHRALYFDQLDAAIAWSDKATTDVLPQFETERLELEVVLLLERATPADDAAAARDAAVLAKTPDTRSFGDAITATLAWWRDGRASPALVTSSADPAAPRLSGRVVDERGRPVAGAEVVSADPIRADRDVLGLALVTIDAPAMARATTDAQGRFSIAQAGRWLAASDHGRRSAAGTGPTLVVGPTRTAHGTVAEVAPRGHSWVSQVAADSHLELRAPIVAGAFDLTVAPTARGVQLVHGELVARSYGPMAPLGDHIALPALGTRSIVVVVRGIAIQGGAITAVAGRITATTEGELDHRASGRAAATNELVPVSADDVANLPPAARRGDLVGALSFLPSTGDLTVCARAYHVDANDPTFVARYAATVADQPVSCQVVAAGTTSIVSEAPAMRPLTR